jgi:hypothetical protein
MTTGATSCAASNGAEHGIPRVVGCEEMRRPGEVARRSARDLHEPAERDDEVFDHEWLLNEGRALRGFA